MPENPCAFALEFSPEGFLLCSQEEIASLADSTPLARAFASGECVGLMTLGGQPAPSDADASVLFWKSVADHLVRTLCHCPTSESPQANESAPDLAEILLPPDASLLAEWTLNAPPMRGAEYLSPDSLRTLWHRLARWVQDRCEECGGMAAFLEKWAPAWTRVGRVTLHLAENPRDPEAPFAFMASYASDVSHSGRLTQLPLGRALQEFAGAGHKAALLKLLTPLHAAARTCSLIHSLVESGDIFHPLAWTPAEAHAFLQGVPAMEEAGLIVRLPNWWKKRGSRPQVAVTMDTRRPGRLGTEELLAFRLSVEMDGKALSAEELKKLLDGADGLVSLRGQWVEVDRAKLQQALTHWERIQAAGGVSFIEGMRLLAGAPRHLREGDALEEENAWTTLRAGEHLAAFLQENREPKTQPPPRSLRAQLRPYQQHGLDWLTFCARAGLGACLADDMGLGKTLQVLSALLREKENHSAQASTLLPESTPSVPPPHLLVVPASLMGNWKQEAARFTPTLQVCLLHRAEQADLTEDSIPWAQTDLVVTTYGMVSRLEWLRQREWNWIILDEAQAVKNAASGQSKAVRSLRGRARVALTGTPIENSLGDLWALFDFLNPGLLGPAATFRDFTKNLRQKKGAHYAPLRRLVAPYILRRLKTDKSILPDLPDKTEMKVFCGLTPTQAKLYQHTADSLAKDLDEAQGMERKGLVLAYLMRFKQICNHPDQLHKSGAFAEKDSAKFQRLSTLATEVASRGEKVLVFTQFRELTAPLLDHLTRLFGRSGLVLHGGTPVKERQALVARFQSPGGPPFFILSLKAGGTGLNLTAANHVVHFDRWWNPAVENQATDRAFRIGQHRNVLVHKFVTTGTLEEKIDALLTEKKDTAEAILSAGAEKALTEMSDAELLDFVKLDIHRAQEAI